MTTPFQMRRLWVDFNEADESDHVRASLMRPPADRVDNRLVVTADSRPTVGEWVELYDDDGATCWAIVSTVRERTVACKLDWSTWRSVETVTVRTWRGQSNLTAVPLSTGKGVPVG